mmetsp:Transcript_1685/g.5239  ORF Transcript_1685/g.5239 Transcript_1685/m.5239 type:complete len:205 (+) Transcript_1685:174-788(+)
MHLSRLRRWSSAQVNRSPWCHHVPRLGTMVATRQVQLPQVAVTLGVHVCATEEEQTVAGGHRGEGVRVACRGTVALAELQRLPSEAACVEHVHVSEHVHGDRHASAHDDARAVGAGRVAGAGLRWQGAGVRGRLEAPCCRLNSGVECKDLVGRLGRRHPLGALWHRLCVHAAHEPQLGPHGRERGARAGPRAFGIREDCAAPLA